jgi:hypothetical protein
MAANEPGQPGLRTGAGGTHGADGLSWDRPTPAVALAIGAHPDDVSSGAAPRRWAATGAWCTTWCAPTDRGTWIRRLT